MGRVMDFEELKVWQEARRIVKEIYTHTAGINDNGFTSQFQRAAVSIMNNIAEGHEYGSRNMFTRFLKIASGSCGEVRSMLYLAVDLKYMEEDVVQQLIQDCKGLSISISALIKSIKK